MAVDYARYITEYFSFLEDESELVQPFIIELRNSLLCLLQSPGLKANTVEEFANRLLALATKPTADIYDIDNLFKKLSVSYISWVADNNVTRKESEQGYTCICTVSGILFNTDDYYDDKLLEMNRSARTKLIKKVQALAQDCMADMYEQWGGNGEALARQYEMQPKKGILKVSVLTQPPSSQTSDNSDSSSASSRSRSPSQSSLSSGD